MRNHVRHLRVWLTLLLCGCAQGPESPRGTKESDVQPGRGYADAHAGFGGDAASGVQSDGGMPERDMEGGIVTESGVCRDARGDAVTQGTVVDDLGTADVEVSGDPCARVYTLTSTQKQREHGPSTRTVAEMAGSPRLRTNNVMFDALYAQALEEARQNSQAVISDRDFGNVTCPPGGCFQTGELWKYVWTRDTAFAVDLGLSAVDPTRALNSLVFKLSRFRSGQGTQIVQDTGSGGSYPISSDRVAWALGARTLLSYLAGDARASFSSQAYDALVGTLEHDREVVFDEEDGLYRGETSFLDWREQTYPSWTASDVVHLGMSKALSTNVLHLMALRVTAQLAREKGKTSSAERYELWADALAKRIVERFWLADASQVSSFITTALDQAPVQRFDALGSALFVLSKLGSEAQRKAVIAGYPLLPKGLPVIWPQQQQTPIYHNRAIWPFVSAYWALAARSVENDAAVAHSVSSLVRASALNLSNMENLEVVSGAPYLEDGGDSGPVVNSRRQLWSVAGYLSMVHQVLFGIDPSDTGVTMRPFLPKRVRRELFPGSTSLVLSGFVFQGKVLTIELSLPNASDGEGAYRVGEVKLNGMIVREGFVPSAELRADNFVEVELVSDASTPQPVNVVTNTERYQNVFGPRNPEITGATANGSNVEISLSIGTESPADVRINVFRNGQKIATGLPGTTKVYLDTGASATGPTLCYSAELCFIGSGTCSQHAAPRCYWGASYERIVNRGPSDFSFSGGRRVNENGRDHIADWGGDLDTLEASFPVTRTGPHLVQVTYANAGPIHTGITCAVKRVDVLEGAATVASGLLLMPHTGANTAWRGSSFVKVELVAGKTYRVRLRADASSMNMSRLSHFERYEGRGGKGGAYEGVDIAELKLLSL